MKPQLWLAHANGLAWDELVLIIGPIVMLAALFLMSRRRPDDADGLEEHDPS